jgi:basic amino acid/polyamine antiporter, APA family
VLPAVYIVGAALVLVTLFVYRPATTWPGLLIVILGVPVYLVVRTRRKNAATDSSITARVSPSE